MLLFKSAKLRAQELEQKSYLILVTLLYKHSFLCLPPTMSKFKMPQTKLLIFPQNLFLLSSPSHLSRHLGSSSILITLTSYIQSMEHPASTFQVYS